MLSALAGFGQIEVRPIKKSGTHRITSQADLPPITLPFWDDFSTSDDKPGDLWEFSNSTTISAGLSKNPPTFQAATLDGIDSLGNVYDNTDNFPGETDQLISRRINLGALTGDESIYLSFFWEGGGNVEVPEDTGDSLRLQFLNSDSVWVTQWQVHAPDLTTTEDFAQEIFKVEASYRHVNFRFRFQTFGSQFGPFDAWHIDYVYLNTGRSSSDLFIEDQALTGQLTSLVDPYYEIPAEHFLVNPSLYITNQNIQAYNLANDPLETLDLQYELVISDETGQIDVITPPVDGSNTLSGPRLTNTVTLDGNYTGSGDDTDDVITISPVDPAPDSINLFTRVFSNFTDDYRINDTLRTSQTFHNYYAYDDGSPEFAAGVAQNGSVAIEYVLETVDTLTHIDIYFPTITPTPVGKTLDIKVWRRLDESNENNLQALKTITVADSTLDSFARVRLISPVVVFDTVYIGYTQKTSDFLPVGLDRNNQMAKSKMSYLSQGDWIENEQANGILMIRPVFDQVPAVPLTATNPYPFKIFPNPSSGKVSISGEYEIFRVWSMAGELMLEDTKKSEYDLSHLTPGIYLAETLMNETSNVQRLVIR